MGQWVGSDHITKIRINLGTYRDNSILFEDGDNMGTT